MRQTILSLLLIGLIVATGFVWQRYVRRAPSAEPERPPEELSLRLAEYRSLKGLRPDTSVLADPFFRALRAPAVPSSPPATGRANPFAPFE